MNSLVYRPTIFQRNEIRWIAAQAWRSGAKARGVAALKAVKQDLNQGFVEGVAAPIAALLRQLFGAAPADAITCVPCGHSRRTDCMGKRLAQSVAEGLGIPFVHLFRDNPRAGSSHPRKSVNLPTLELIGTSPRSVIVVDDLATSGCHLEQAVATLRRLGTAASAVAWISGSASRGEVLPAAPSEMAPKRLRIRPARVGASLWE